MKNVEKSKITSINQQKMYNPWQVLRMNKEIYYNYKLTVYHVVLFHWYVYDATSRQKTYSWKKI